MKKAWDWVLGLWSKLKYSRKMDDPYCLSFNSL
jgi:hypothetical protein